MQLRAAVVRGGLKLRVFWDRRGGFELVDGYGASVDETADSRASRTVEEHRSRVDIRAPVGLVAAWTVTKRGADGEQAREVEDPVDALDRARGVFGGREITNKHLDRQPREAAHVARLPDEGTHIDVFLEQPPDQRLADHPRRSRDERAGYGRPRSRSMYAAT